MPAATAPALFGTIPAKDRFEVFDGAKPRAERVVELLDYKKDDVAAATGVAKSSIRYDERMPDELRARIREWAIALNLVASFFDDEDKALLWFQIPNPMLGNVAPRDMIRIGRFNRLLKFIQTALSENRR